MFLRILGLIKDPAAKSIIKTRLSITRFLFPLF
jgi:hypothetical protein